MQNIKDKFNALELLPRAKESPFKQLFLAYSVQFSGTMIHQLLMRMIKSKSLNEIHIHVSGKNLRFGIGEFALITRLNVGEDPREDVPNSTRLMKTYLNNNASVRSQELDDAFIGCIDEEDAWKLGLCYFVDGVLYANESQTKVDMYLFSLVENEEAFF